MSNSLMRQALVDWQSVTPDWPEQLQAWNDELKHLPKEERLRQLHDRFVLGFSIANTMSELEE